jgi:tetratricopeptide (TPR) repeat protein
MVTRRKLEGAGLVRADIDLLCARALRVAEVKGFEQASSLLRQALAVAGKDRRLQGRVEVAQCRLARLRGDLGEAQKQGRHALELLQQHGDSEDVAEAAIYLASVEGVRSNFPAAEALYKRALRLLVGSENQRLLALAHWGMGSTSADQERFQEAYEHLRIALECGRDLLTLTERGRLQETAAINCRDRGVQDEALDRATQALHAFEVAGEPERAADVHNVIGSIHGRCGDPRAARTSYEQALAALNGEVAPEAAEAYYELARLELEGGRPNEALESAQKALQLARELRSPAEEGRAALIFGQVLMSLDRPPDAIPHLRRAQAIFSECGMQQSEIVATDILHHAEGGA